MADLLPHEDPKRRCLRVAEWPERDRIAWERALAPGDILDGTVGPGFHWRPQTREKHRKGYGRWLTFLITSGLLETDIAPDDRLTSDRVTLYIEQLTEQDVGTWTIWGRLAELLAAIKVISPDTDFGWLRRIVRYYENNTVDKRNKLERLQPADRILNWAIEHMDQNMSAPPLRDPEVAFRDALIVGFLSCCPIRLGNLALIEIGQHIRRTSSGYILRFSAAETKTGHPYAAPMAEVLTHYLDHYILELRPKLMVAGPTDRLWLTRYGKPMRDSALHSAITRTTERAFGKPINPHLFRDCAATFVALEDPEHVRIAAPLLGHTDPRATEHHYIQANQIVAGRRIRSSVAKMRRQLDPKNRSSRS